MTDSAKDQYQVLEGKWPEIELMRPLKGDGRLRFAPSTPAPGYEATTKHLTETYVPKQQWEAEQREEVERKTVRRPFSDEGFAPDTPMPKPRQDVKPPSEFLARQWQSRAESAEKALAEQRERLLGDEAKKAAAFAVSKVEEQRSAELMRGISRGDVAYPRTYEDSATAAIEAALQAAQEVGGK